MQNCVSHLKKQSPKGCTAHIYISYSPNIPCLTSLYTSSQSQKVVLLGPQSSVPFYRCIYTFDLSFEHWCFSNFQVGSAVSVFTDSTSFLPLMSDFVFPVAVLQPLVSVLPCKQIKIKRNRVTGSDVMIVNHITDSDLLSDLPSDQRRRRIIWVSRLQLQRRSFSCWRHPRGRVHWWHHRQER